MDSLHKISSKYSISIGGRASSSPSSSAVVDAEVEEAAVTVQSLAVDAAVTVGELAVQPLLVVAVQPLDVAVALLVMVSVVAV